MKGQMINSIGYGPSPRAWFPMVFHNRSTVLCDGVNDCDETDEDMMPKISESREHVAKQTASHLRTRKCKGDQTRLDRTNVLDPR